MNAYRTLRLVFSLLSILLIAFLVILYSFSNAVIPPINPLQGLEVWRWTKFLMRKSMEQNHVFIPASHPYLHVRCMALGPVRSFTSFC